MTLDRIDALNVLDHYGIRVVRAKHVDSAEDAIAFAGRRDARDPREVPVVLRASGRTEGPLRDAHAIRAAYERLSASAEPSAVRIDVEEDIGPGTDVTIAGRSEGGTRFLALGTGEHRVERMLPLDAAGAEILAEHYRPYHHRGPRERERRMLEHLLMRVSELFAELEIDTLALDPVRLHENAYTVLDAVISAPAHLHLEERLARHAMDRKSYDYHPSGRQ